MHQRSVRPAPPTGGGTLSVLDGFDLLADIYRAATAKHRHRHDELVAVLRSESLLDWPVRQLSLGRRMRAEFAAALLHTPTGSGACSPSRRAARLRGLLP